MDDDAAQSPDVGDDDATVRQLQGFGFGREAVVSALAAHRGDADQALLSLMGEEGGVHADDEGRASQPPPHPAAAASPSTDWESLPPEIVEVLGRWLAEHLDHLVERQCAGETEPYLHPMCVRQDQARRGRARTAASLSVLRAVRACRQTCRVWRDCIAYSRVTQLALDGVLSTPPILPGLSDLPPPADSVGLQASGRPMLWTWWKGHRPIPFPRLKIRRHRCPACRHEARPLEPHPVLVHFLQEAGLSRWCKHVVAGHGDAAHNLGVSSINQLRRLTATELRSLPYEAAALETAIPRLH